jgi:hypothetical protein
MVKAHAADRSALYHVRAKVKETEAYIAGDLAKQSALIAEAEEASRQKRFENSNSGLLSQYSITYMTNLL